MLMLVMDSARAEALIAAGAGLRHRMSPLPLADGSDRAARDPEGRYGLSASCRAAVSEALPDRAIQLSRWTAALLPLGLVDPVPGDGPVQARAEEAMRLAIAAWPETEATVYAPSSDDL